VPPLMSPNAMQCIDVTTLNFSFGVKLREWDRAGERVCGTP